MQKKEVKIREKSEDAKKEKKRETRKSLKRAKGVAASGAELAQNGILRVERGGRKDNTTAGYQKYRSLDNLRLCWNGTTKVREKRKRASRKGGGRIKFLKHKEGGK